MKDLIVKGATLRKEIVVLLYCIGLAIVVNVIAIAAYGTRWIELLTQLHVTIAFGIALYILLLVLRLIFRAVKAFTSGQRGVA